MPISTAPKAPAEKAAPKTPVKKTAAKPADPAERMSSRASGLNDWFAVGSMLCVLRGQLADAAACEEHGKPISAVVAGYAEDNETVGHYVDIAVAMGPVAAVGAVILPFLAQLAVNHGRMNADALGTSFGVFPPDVLEGRMKLKILKEQQRIAEETAAAEAEIARLNSTMQDEAAGGM